MIVVFEAKQIEEKYDTRKLQIVFNLDTACVCACRCVCACVCVCVCLRLRA